MSARETKGDAKGWERGEKGFARSKDDGEFKNPPRSNAAIKKQYGDVGIQVGMADDKDYSR